MSLDAFPPRYTALVPVASGSFGRVYRAMLDGAAVALKVLVEDRPEAQWAFDEEVRRLDRFDHPGLPRLLDQGRTGEGRPYLAMTWAEGETPAGPGQLRAVLEGVREVLGYMHALGYVHGDLKAENVKVADGRVMLLDLGLVARTGTARDRVSGTLEYLAPEAFRLAPVAPAADLYALGVLGFLLRTGHLPFEGPPAALVEAHLRTPVPALSGGELDGFIRELLAKEPSRRLLAAGVQRGLDPGAYLDVAGVLDAPAGVLRILGGEGLGKSRALDACRLEALIAGRRWGGARCGAADAPAAPLRAAVGQVLGAATGRVGAWLSGQPTEELARLEPASRQAALLVAVAEALAAAGPVTIGLDDWHLADDASREALAVLRHGAPGVRWVLTEAGEPAEAAAGRQDGTGAGAGENFGAGAGAEPGAGAGSGPGAGAGSGPGAGVRSEPGAGAGSELGAGAGEAPGAGWVAERRVWLRAWTAEEQGVWLAGRLGGVAPAGLAQSLAAASGGVPGLLEALLEDAVAGGALVADGEGWRFEAEQAGGKKAAERLAAAWAGRVAGLSPAARQVGALLAIARTPLSAWELAQLVEGDVGAAAEELAAAGLARGPAAALHLTTATLAAPLLQGLEHQPAMRTALARQLAPDPRLDRALAAARLALAGDDLDFAATLATQVAKRCLDAVAAAEALELTAGALDPEARFLHAEAARLLDKTAEAAAAYEALLDTPWGARAAFGLAKCLQLRGDYAGASAALARARGDGAELDVRVGLAAARLAVYENAMPEALALVDEAVRAARAGGFPVLLAQALTLRGVLGIQHDPAAGPEAIAWIREAIALGEAAGDRLAVARMQDNLGNAQLGTGALAEAAEAFARFADGMAALGNETDLLSARLNQARVAADLGQAEAAAHLAAEAARRATQASRKMPEGLARGVLSQAAWREGDLARAQEALQQAGAIAAGLKTAYVRAYVSLFALDLALVRGDLPAAVKALREASAAGGEVGRRAEVARAQLLLLQGDATAALEAAQALTGSFDRWIAFHAETTRAEAALALDDPAQAAEAAGVALGIAEGWRSPWHMASARLLQARASGRPAELREAHDLAAGAGNPYARLRAAALLAETGDERATAAGPALDACLRGLSPRAATAFVQRWDLAVLGAARPGAGTAALAAAFDELARAEDDGGVAQAVLRGAMALTRAQRGYLLAYEDGRLARAVTHGLDYAAEVEVGFSHSIAEHALFASEPVYLRDAGTDERWQAAASVMALGLKTVVATALATPDEILGVVYLDRTDPEPLLTPADLGALQTLARAGARALADRQALAASRAEARRLAAAAELGRTLLTATDRQAAVLEAMRRTAGAERAFRLSPGEALPPDVSQGITAWVLAQGQPLALIDVGAHEDWAGRGSVQALGVRTVWCLPAGGGVAYLDAASAEGDVGPAMLATLAEQASFLA